MRKFFLATNEKAASTNVTVEPMHLSNETKALMELNIGHLLT